jgi:hypothetical protein
VPDAAREGPAPGDAVAAGRGARLARRHVAAGGERHPAIVEDHAHGVVAEEHAGQGAGGGADHQAPAGGRIDRGQCLDHVDLRDGIRLGAAEDGGKLEGEQAAVAERGHRRRRQRPHALGLVGTVGHRRTHALHRVEQRTARATAVDHGSRNSPRATVTALPPTSTLVSASRVPAARA